MKVNEDILRLDIESDDPDPTAIILEGEEVKNNRAFLESFSQNTRAHLNALKKELFQAIRGSGYTVADLGLSEEDLKKPDKGEDDNFFSKATPETSLESFFNKAYTVQEFDKETHKGIENRYQHYIYAGEQFTEKCEQSEELSGKQKFINDAGKMLGAINTSISQLNHIENDLRTENYDQAGGKVGVLLGCFKTVTATANETEFAKVTTNPSRVERILAAISESYQSFKNFFKSSSEIDQQKFSDLGKEYNLAKEKESFRDRANSQDGFNKALEQATRDSENARIICEALGAGAADDKIAEKPSISNIFNP